MIDPLKIFPIIKGLTKKEPGDTRESMVVSDAEFPYHEEVAEGLGVFFAIDMGNYFQYIKKGQLATELSDLNIRQRAYKNLTKHFGGNVKIEVVQKNLYMAAGGGEYEASIMLMNEFWDDVVQKLKSEVYVAIPNREILLFTLKNETCLGSLRKAVKQVVSGRDFKGLINMHVYMRSEGQWIIENLD